MARLTPIRALVVDDEEHARASVRQLLHDQTHWQVIGECDSAASLTEAVARSVPDVVFLDIRLPGADGISLARLLQRLVPRPLVVFTTAYETYAVDAFEVQAIDYLLKPFDDARFQAALRRVEQALAAAGGAEHAARDAGATAWHARRLVIRSIGRVQFVNVAQIDWMEASGNYIEIHCGKETHLYRERLHVLESQLDPRRFLRIHRSLIVNRDSISEIRPIAGGDYAVFLRDGERLRLSRTYREALASLQQS